MKTWLEQAREKGLIASETVVKPEPLQNSATVAELPKGVSEAEFQTAVIDLAHTLGWRVAHFRKVRVQRKGGATYWETPVAADGKGFLDLELVRGPRLLKVELKVGKNPLTPEQKAWIAAYEETAVEVYVWRPENWGELRRILE